MPETIARDCTSIFASIKAREKQLTVVPMPQPGHQMCGMRSDAQKRFNGIRYQRAHRVASRMTFRMSSGRVDAAAGMGNGEVLQCPLAARSTSRTICPRLSSGTTNALTWRRSREYAFPGRAKQ